jgi:pre-mRNA-splicing factor CWC22
LSLRCSFEKFRVEVIFRIPRLWIESIFEMPRRSQSKSPSPKRRRRSASGSPKRRRRSVSGSPKRARRDDDRRSPSASPPRRGGRRRSPSPRRNRRDSRSPLRQKRQEEVEKPKIVEEKKEPMDILRTRTGGAYIPPAKLKMLQDQIADKNSEQYQRMNWERLKKKIHGQVNKVNVGNLVTVVRELLQENIIRGK